MVIFSNGFRTSPAPPSRSLANAAFSQLGGRCGSVGPHWG